MAESDLLITISGAALSLLFYENVRSCSDQMGFLLGETLEFVVKTYTDSDNQIETVKIHNNIETVVTCPLPEILHDSVGRINKEKLKDFIRDKGKQVIGWFRFRRNTGLVPTMRDKMLHKEFASYFSGSNGSKEEFFVTCLLSSSTSSGKGTHKFKHVFLRRRRGTFEPVSLRINNLGNDSFRHDGSDYKPTPTKRSTDVPDVFSRLIESLNLNLTRTSGVESAINIQKAAEGYLDRLIPELCQSDFEVAELEKQVKEFKLNKITKINGSANNIDKNYDIEKDHVIEKKQIPKKVLPSRIESPDLTCDDRRMLKAHSNTTSQPNSTYKSRNAIADVEKSINQNKTRTNTEQNPPPINTISETKIDTPETVLSKNRRVSNMESEILKESICKGETCEIGVGRGRGRSIHNSHPGPRKSGRVSGSIATRSSERTSHTQVSHQESSEANCIQNPSTQASYSQVTKKVDNTHKSNLTETH
ncbi:BRISC complex subunit FAM175B [Calliopsis andreniformis]|uniref:BRISC complex subunit FAM175B n=1 Tax=Calliopsis andreniformis TaxID=337506 RepID=UPI003FCEAA81